MERHPLKRQVFTAISAALLSIGLAHGEGFTLTSPDVSGQLSAQQEFSGFGCHGGNISPRLQWKNAPKHTKSFAVTVYDLDAPTGSGWWHWVIFNIPANVHRLKSNAGDIARHIAPKGSIQSVTDYGKPGFGGACPPVGDKAHRYVFTVFALKAPTLTLRASTPPAMVGYYLNQDALAKSSLIAYFARPK
ncbi:MAG TPA: phosphatidylethanolamine-binding protein [Betaproteobacteria bacterium]|nr:phosphatidylethanolamine-binding protein [Betaproteobacteria bacterium]